MYRGNKGVVVYPSQIPGVYLDPDSEAWVPMIYPESAAMKFLKSISGHNVKAMDLYPYYYVFVKEWKGVEWNLFVMDALIATAAFSGESLNHLPCDVVTTTCTRASNMYQGFGGTYEGDVSIRNIPPSESPAGIHPQLQPEKPVIVVHEMLNGVKSKRRVETTHLAFERAEDRLTRFLDEQDPAEVAAFVNSPDNRVCVMTNTGLLLFDNTKVARAEGAPEKTPSQLILDSLDDEL